MDYMVCFVAMFDFISIKAQSTVIVYRIVKDTAWKIKHLMNLLITIMWETFEQLKLLGDQFVQESDCQALWP